MASVSAVLAGVLALSGPASARLFERSNNLINLGGNGVLDARDIDSAPVIRAPVDNEILKPIRPSTDTKSAAKSSSNLFAPRDADTLLWGGKATMAELKVSMPGKQEGIVDAELFDDLVDSFDCPKEGADGKLTVKFKDASDFKTASKAWSWVSEAKDNHFVFMVGDGDCSWNEDRALFHVNDLDLDEGSNSAVFDTEATTFKKAIHTFDLDIGKSVAKKHAARDITPSFNVPMDFDLTGKGVSFNMNGVDYVGNCNNCTSTGSFDIEGHFSMDWFDISEATVDVTTAGISTTAVLGITLKGQLTDSLLEKEFPLFKASPAGVAIPGVVDIGPTLTVGLRAGVNAIKGGVTMTLGGTATIPASSAHFDFLNEDGMSSDGWQIEAEATPLEADVFVEARAYTSLTPSLGLEISAFETGFAAQVSSDLPVLAGLLKAVHSLTCNACGKYENAIDGSITLGTNIGVALQKKVEGTLNDLWSLTFYDASLDPLASLCEPVGPQDNCPANGTFTTPSRRSRDLARGAMRL